MACGELTPVMAPSKPAWRTASPKEEPIRPVPTMTTFCTLAPTRRAFHRRERRERRESAEKTKTKLGGGSRIRSFGRVRAEGAEIAEETFRRLGKLKHAPPRQVAGVQRQMRGGAC